MTQVQDPQMMEETRRDIVQKAMDLFTHYGFSKTNIGDIAKACDMSAGNLYRYFRNKQAIGNAVVGDYMAGIEACIAAEVAKQPTAEAAIRFIVTASVMHMVEELRQAPKIVELSEMVCETDEGMAIIKAHSLRIQGLIADLIRQGNETGEFQVSDIERAARGVVFGTKFFQVPFAIARHGLDQVEGDLTITLDLLCAGLRAPASS